MKIALILIAVVITGYVGYQVIRIRGLVQKGIALGQHEKLFTREEGNVSLLVLGDSTAVGLGTSDPKYSVAGRLSDWLNASVENHAKSGAIADDMVAQLSLAQKDQYDLILIQVGANDVIRFHSASAANIQLDTLLQKLTQKSNRIVLLTAGKIGEAPFFPKPFGFLWNNGAARLRTLFMATAQKYGVVYVDLFSIADPFATDTQKYYAADGLHLSDDGYGFWYDQVKVAISENWHELVSHE
jgi:lysophospholipase L1-like esterase